MTVHVPPPMANLQAGDQAMTWHGVSYAIFATDRGSFLYDRASNACVPIHAGSQLIIDDYLRDRSDTTRNRFKGVIGEDELLAALEQLDTLSRHGLLRESQQDDPSSLCQAKELEKILASPCRHLTLNVTDQCNLRCTYCIYSGRFSEERTHGSRQMSWEVARQSLDYFLSYSHPDQRLTLYGGEPLLNWDLVSQCIAYVRRTRNRPHIPIQLTTNLIRLSSEQATFVVENNVNLQVSLDGPEEMHDSARLLAGGGGSHALVLRGIKRLMELDGEYCRTRLKINCTCSSDRSVHELFMYFSAHPFTDIDVSVSCVRTPDGEKDITSHEAWSAWQKQLDDLIPEYFSLIRAGKPFNYRMFRNFFETVYVRLARRPLAQASASHLLKKQCIPGVNGIFVDAGGKYFACENFAHPENCIGSVETGVELEKSRRLLTKFTAISAEMCSGCWALRLCTLCFLHSLDQGEISKKKMLKNCEIERKRILKAFERFILIWEHEPEPFHSHEFSLHSAVMK
jgi:uncharacterized protein